MGISSLAVSAAVDYTAWSQENIAELIENAKQQNKMILVNITQPDWCPPCIRLENAIFSNPDEKEFSKLAKDWLAIEVLGYDKQGAAFLAQQNLFFHGTPTVFLLDPNRANAKSKAETAREKLKNKKRDLKLGELKVVHSVASFPDDFTAQFSKAVGGYDLVAEAQKSVRTEQTLEAYQALALAYVNQGQVKPANRVYQSMLFRDDLSSQQIQDIEWEQIFQVTQRVEKDHAKSVRDIDAFIKKYPKFIQDKKQFETYAYRRSWSLVELNRVAEANALLKKAFVEPYEIDGVADYLYFAFRNPKPELLNEAKLVCDKALQDFPQSKARLKAAEGRLLRRLNKLQQAKESFTQAISLLDVESDSYADTLETYQGQLAFVNAEIEKQRKKEIT